MVLGMNGDSLPYSAHLESPRHMTMIDVSLSSPIVRFVVHWHITTS